MDSILAAFLTLFLVVDPIGNVFIFIALTQGFSAKIKRFIAFKAILIASIVLGCFLLFGEKFLSTIGIDIAAFRVAGGLMLFATGFEMLFGQRQKRKSNSAEAAAEESHDQMKADAMSLATFPLAIPLIAGPGSMTAAMLLGTDAGGDPFQLGLTFFVVLTVLLLSLVLLLLASPIEKAIGQSGGVVLTRVFGILLSALAVQYIFDGVRESFGI